MSRPALFLDVGVLLGLVVAVIGKDACIDNSLSCARNAYQCNTNSHVQGKCKKTCNLCENGSKPDTCATLNCPSSNALCVDGGGSTPSRCQCKNGFREDGNSCLDTCATLNCPTSNAVCVEGGGSIPSRCQCKNGFRENGISCIDTCATLNCPTSNAVCVEGAGSTPSRCQCKNGFKGDGNSCLDTCATLNCPTSNAVCVEGAGSTPSRCQCKNGFKGDGNSCLEPVRVTDISAPTINFECGVGYTTYITPRYTSYGYDYGGGFALPQPVYFSAPTPRPAQQLGYFLAPTPRPAHPSTSQSVPGLSDRRRRRGLVTPPPSPRPTCLSQGGFGVSKINGGHAHDSASGFDENGFGIGISRVPKNKYPWMALLGSRDKAGARIWFCGGVLINRRWVLTAAHCTNKFNATVVRLGEHDFERDDEGDHEDFNVAEVLFHYGYKHPQQYHDIALIRLATAIKIRREMSPVCLPWGKEADLPLVGINVTVSGWGTTRYFNYHKLSPSLNEIDVTVLPTDVCASSYSKHAQDFTTDYPNSIGEETLCIGDISNQTLVKDACTGDSGGPAVVNRDGHYSVVGIVSQGFGCGKKEFPGLYVKVQHPQHLAWIKRLAFTTCENLCIHGTCNPSIGCLCSDEWSGEFCDTPICDPQCLRGQCVSPNVCECEPQWSGSQCQIPMCVNGKNSLDSLSCSCDSGWQDDLCNTPICDPPCVQGDCLKPNSCSCYCPWYGDQCEHLWCQHGNSSDGLTCTCDVGWSGTHCDIIICTNGNVVDTFASFGESTRCDCDVRWGGTHCDIIAICNPPCVNGNCVAPNQCDCDGHSRYDVLKWSGDLCHCDYGRHGDQCQHRLQCHDYEDHFYMGNQCFFTPKSTDSWDPAQALCKKVGGFLAEPNNLPNFQKAVRDNLTYVGTGFWVGGRKEKDNTWIWSSDGTKVGNSENWSPAEHRYSHESHDCFSYNRETEYFEDKPCEQYLFDFVCEIRHQ